MNSGFLTDKIRPARPSTRMDNETYRIRVEDLFKQLHADDAPGAAAVGGETAVEGGPALRRQNEAVREQLEELALLPRKARHFLRVLNDQPADVQAQFLRFLMEKVTDKDFPKDLERHIRHRFYEARDEFKQLLTELEDEISVAALMRVIALTEEGWLAGELIRILLGFEAEVLRGPVRDALASQDYLLQCLGIYLAGKSKSDPPLEELSVFYRRPVGDKVDRLESKAYDALMEGIEGASDELLLRWLRDPSSRVRDLGVVSVVKRRLASAVGDLMRLVLVDAKTRARAAQAMLEFHEEALFRFDEEDPGGRAMADIFKSAKQKPLLNMFRELIRDENGAVREVAIRSLPLLRDPSSLVGIVGRVATEDRLRGVQLAALETLAKLAPERFFDAAADTLADPGNLHPDVVSGMDRIIEETLSEKEQKRLRAEAEQRRKRREEVLDKFTGTIESWRHDLE